MNKITFVLAIIVIFVLLFSGCSQINKNIENTPSIGTPTYLISTLRRLPPTWTKTPTQITPSVTPSPSSTATPSPTVTYTLLPTLPELEAQLLTQKMMSESQNCKLPCWWGIHPGVTPWGDANNFLLTIHNEITVIPSEKSKNEFLVIVNSPYLESSYDTVFEIYVIDGLVQLIYLSDESSKNFYIQKLFQSHGEPEEILVNTFPYTMFNPIPFTLLLSYPKEGFIAVFEGEATVINNDENAIYCPGKSTPTIYLIGAMDRQRFEENKKRIISAYYNDMPIKGMFPLEEASSWNNRAFYNQVVNETNTCINTMLSKWILK